MKQILSTLLVSAALLVSSTAFAQAPAHNAPAHAPAKVVVVTKDNHVKHVAPHHVKKPHHVRHAQKAHKKAMRHHHRNHRSAHKVMHPKG